MTQLILIGVAWATLPNATTYAHHKQKWNGVKWLHRHETQCEPFPDYWTNGSPWHYNTGTHGLQGASNTSEWLTYTPCAGIPTSLVPAVVAAFGAYSRGGVAVTQTAAICQPMLPTDAEGDPPTAHTTAGWFATADTENEFVFDEVHGIRFAVSDTSTDYYCFATYDGTTPGIVRIDSREMLTPPVGWSASNPDANWEMFLNGVDYIWTGSQPSELLWPPGGGSPSVDKHITDIVMHEFMHVLGAGHPSAQDIDLFPSAVHGGVSTFSHLGLEVDAEIYEPNLGPVSGIYELPFIDRAFLLDKYSQQQAGGLHIHQWEGGGIGQLPTRVHVGWEGESSSSTLVDYNYFETQSLENSNCLSQYPPQDLGTTFENAVEAAMPRFTSRDAYLLEVTFGTMDPDDSDSQWSVADIEGKAYITVPGNGNYSTVISVDDLEVSYASTDMNATSGTQVDALVTATFTDSATSTELYTDVPLNVLLNVTGCDEP